MCLERISFMCTSDNEVAWMLARAGMTEKTPQKCHSRESGNPVFGKRICNLL